MSTKRVTVCGVPYDMSIVDGGVMFSDKGGFYGVATRIMFEYRQMLWWIVDSDSTFRMIPLAHVERMASLLREHIGGDHTKADGSTFTLAFKGTP